MSPGVLTTRQRQIVTMFCTGKTGREIASTLGLALETINPTLKQAARRMGATGIARATLLEWACATNNIDKEICNG